VRQVVPHLLHHLFEFRRLGHVELPALPVIKWCCVPPYWPRLHQRRGICR
jgi:hypothetical protein